MLVMLYFFLLVTNFSLIFSTLVSLEQNHWINTSREVETQLHEIHRLIGLAKFKFAYQTVDIILPSIVVIVVSYMYIVTTVLKIPSSEGRKTAFSTCSSHLGVVSLLYGTVSFVYLTRPNNPELRKVVSVFYILVTPMLNPLIYSLRNKDVKQALRKILWKKKSLLFQG